MTSMIMNNMNTTMVANETEQLALHELTTSALETLPPSETAAYRKAALEVPHLVETEAHPLWFLRTEQGRPGPAAVRMALYWKHRVSTFQDQAYQSLDACLSQEDKHLLDAQAFGRLPDLGSVPVLILDLDLVGSTDKYHASRNRLVFYWAYRLGSCSAAHAPGLHLIRVLKDINLGTTHLQRRLGLMDDAMPFRVQQYVICCLFPLASQQKYFMREAFPNYCKAVSLCVPGRFQIPMAQSKEEMLANLKSLYGFEASGLPPALGGTWTQATTSKSEQQEQEEKPAAKRVKLDKKPLPMPAATKNKVLLATTTTTTTKQGALLQALDRMRREQKCLLVELLGKPAILHHCLGSLRQTGGTISTTPVQALPPTQSNEEDEQKVAVAPKKETEKSRVRMEILKRVVERLEATKQQQQPHAPRRRGPNNRNNRMYSQLVSLVSQKLVARKR